MESSRKILSVVAFFVLLVVVTEVAQVQADARVCERDSEKFKGLCMDAENCASVCKTEGFVGGRCSNFKRRCVCIKAC